MVFTLPDGINALAMHQPKIVYDTLFEATWDTLQTFGKAKEIQMGMIAVLHTWGQQLSLHPHLHCIVPDGSVDKDGQWKNSRSDGKFLFPVKALSKVLGLNIAPNSRRNDLSTTNKSGRNYDRNHG